MGRNGARPRDEKTATKDRMKHKTAQRKRKEQELLEIATDLAIEMYEPALKELKKY